MTRTLHWSWDCPLLRLDGADDVDGCLIVVVGELDLSNAALAREQIMDAAHRSTGPVTLDLAGLTFAGIAGIRVLAGLAEWCAVQERPLRIVAVPRTVGRITRASGFAGLLDPSPDGG